MSVMRLGVLRCALLSISIVACLFGQPLHGAGSVVINEFNPKPEDTHDLEEFVELHNPGDADVDLSGWSLSDAVSYTIPAGTLLPAGGYMVIAMNPAALQVRYGVASLGPWSGKLNSTGEKIVVKNAGGVVQDSVDYKFGFPWPCKIDGEGGSAELINPGLDNDLGSSWRASGTSVEGVIQSIYIAASDSDWSYKKATAEASSPVTEWRNIGFDDSTWEVGQAPFGYGDAGISTTFSDMSGTSGYAGAYFRKKFTVSAGNIPEQLHLRLNVDDGCVVWINGVEVKRRNVPAGQLAFNGFSSANVEQAWEDIIIPNAGAFLVEGTNVVTIHGLNSSLTSGDFFFNMELSAAGSTVASLPTPGAVNRIYHPLSSTPPNIRQVVHAPEKPLSGQAVTVTAKITDADGVGNVSLEYQIVEPGAYIRLTDAAYQMNWITLPMIDSGTAGDVMAGDGIYTTVVPGNVQVHRRLVRYRIRFSDALGNVSRAPFADDVQSNFSWFTYNGLPAWSGALRPAAVAPGGATAVQTFSAQTLSSVPVYTLIANSTDVMDSQYGSSSNKVRFRGTFIADGVVYDNIEFRNRGQNSTYQTGKNKWRFNFNPGYDFHAKDNYGRQYEESWGSFSANANSGPWVPVHKGSTGIEEATSLKLFQLAGVPSPSAHYYHFRVIRNATETPTAGTRITDAISASGQIDGQYAGDFWGTYLAIERVKGGFLDSRGLPEGNIYKIEASQGEAENLAPGYTDVGADWVAFRDASLAATPPTEAWWRANMDMDAYYTFHALNRLTGNVDLRKGENHFFYHRTSTDGRWVPIPWDLDMMYVAKWHKGTTLDGTFYPGVIDQHRSILQNPNLAREYRNRAREVLDLMASDSSRTGGQIGQLFNEYAQIVSPDGTTDNLANADAAMWNLHPRAKGTVDSSTGLGATSGQANHRGNYFRAVFMDTRSGGSWTRQLGAPGFTGTPVFQDLVNYFVGYATNTFPAGQTWVLNNGNQYGYGYQCLLAEAADAAIPQKPVLAYTGVENYPVDRLAFSSSVYAGTGAYASTQWRVAEISSPGLPGYVSGKNKYEIEQGWTITGTGRSIGIPPSAVSVGKTYRARVRYWDVTGRSSNWSAPIQFTVGNEAARVVHYWNFNGSTYASSITSVAGVGSEIVTQSGPGSAFLTGTGQSFSSQNARYGDAALEHLRVNNPIGASVIFKLPTTGHEKISAAVETRRSGSGAGLQSWSYTLDGVNYISLPDVVVPDGTPSVIGFDFKTIAGADQNPLFALKVTFSAGAGGVEGNNRFDNFVLTGTPLPGSYSYWAQRQFDAVKQLSLLISGPNADPDGDGRSNFTEFALGTSPEARDTPYQSFLWSDSGGSSLPALKIHRPVTRTGISYELQTSNTLSQNDWVTVANSAAESAVVNGMEEAVFRDATHTSGQAKKFLRMKITPSSALNP